jgi:hypothetical protein
MRGHTELMAKRNVGGKEGKRPLIITPRYRCEDNIKMYVREIGWRCDGLDLSGSLYGPVEGPNKMFENS